MTIHEGKKPEGQKQRETLALILVVLVIFAAFGLIKLLFDILIKGGLS